MKKGISLLAFVLAMLMVLTSCMPLSMLAPGSSQRPALPTTPEVKPTTPPGTVTTAPTQTTAPAVNETTAPPTTVTTATTASTATTAATEPVVPGGVYVDLDFDYGNNAIVDKKGNVVCTPVGNSAVKEVDVIHNGSVLKKNALVINDANKQSWVECTFTNIADYAQLNKLVEEARGWTVEAFYLNASKSTNLQGIVCVTERSQGWGLAERNGAPYLVTANGRSYFFAHSNYTTSTTEFYHVVGVYDAVAQANKTYINGELKGEVQNVTGFAAAQATDKNGFVMGTGFFIGGDPSASSAGVDFPVSDLTVVDVKIYTGALTASEVSRAYAEIAAEFKSAEKPEEELVIFLDPGHGGEDPGTTGEYEGVTYKESEISLSVALKAKAKLEALGYKVVLSRTDDTFVNLANRPAAAIEANANMFISVHVNSSAGSTAKGLEVYYSGKDVNYDAKAFAELFAKEFEDIKDVAGSIDTANPAYPDMTVRGAKADTELYPNGLAVLNQKETYMPSVLIELGFISNESDFAMLRDAYWQNFAAEAIADAVVAAHTAGVYKK